MIVLGSIFVGWATPTEAAGVGAFGSVLLAWFNRRLNRETVTDVTQRTAKITAMVFMIVVGATAFSYVFRSLGGEEVIEASLLGLPFGSWGILFVLMGVVFLLGFFFDWIEITLIVLPVFGPIVGKLDFGPMFATVGDQTLWFAMLVAINLQTSFLTPPFGFALFYLKGVAPPNVQLGHLYRGIIPFVILQLIGLAIVFLFPELVTWLPKIALGRGFSRTSSAIIKSAPPSSPGGAPSSAGWKMNFTVPGNSSRIEARTDATPICTAVWMSWPHACMTPTSLLR